MKEFEKWYYHVELEGVLWPSFGRYDTGAELIAAKEAWIAALKWTVKVLDKDKLQGWPMRASKVTIEKELNAKT